MLKRHFLSTAVELSIISRNALAAEIGQNASIAALIHFLQAASKF